MGFAEILPLPHRAYGSSTVALPNFLRVLGWQSAGMIQRTLEMHVRVAIITGRRGKRGVLECDENGILASLVPSSEARMIWVSGVGFQSVAGVLQNECPVDLWGITYM